MHLILGKKQATEKNDGKRKRGKEGSHQNGRQVARPAKAGSADPCLPAPDPTEAGAGRKGTIEILFLCSLPVRYFVPQEPPGIAG